MNGEPMSRIRNRAILAGVFVVGLGLVPATGPANAAETSILNIGPGHLVAKGAAVDVPVTFVCDPYSGVDAIHLELTQEVNKGRSAIGQQSTRVTCTGETQTITASINASTRGVAFKNGTAEATASFCIPDVFSCGFSSITREVTLKNK